MDTLDEQVSHKHLPLKINANLDFPIIRNLALHLFGTDNSCKALEPFLLFNLLAV